MNIRSLLHFGSDKTLSNEFNRLVQDNDEEIIGNNSLEHLDELGDVYLYVAQNKESNFALTSLLDDTGNGFIKLLCSV